MPGSWPVLPPTGTERVIDGRYRLRHSLGVGGLGEVFYAEDLKTEPPGAVAFKLLHAELLEDQQARADFSREAALMRRLYHPNILRMLGFQLRADLGYLVTTYAEKGSLQSLLQPNPDLPPHPLTFDQLLSILRQVAEALDYLHRERLVHRDLKPANILLLSGEQAVLADFSLTISLSSQTPADLIKADAWGTPLYAAPEIWSDQVGKASDIYSLGVMTYQLITGATPFEGTPDELKELHRNAPVPALSAARSNLVYPLELDELIAAAMAKNPHERPFSAGEFYRRLNQLLDPLGRGKVDPATWGQAGATLPVSSPAVTTPSLQTAVCSTTSRPLSNPAPAPVSGVKSALVSLGTFFGFMFLLCIILIAVLSTPRRPSWYSTGKNSQVYDTPRPDPPHSVPVSTTYTFINNNWMNINWLRMPQVHHGTANVVSWLSGGSVNFYSGGEDGQLKRWFMANDTVQALGNPDHYDKPITALAVTPDRNTLAVALNDGSITLSTIGGYYPLKLNFHNKAVTSLAWSPDGKLLVSASADKTAHLTTVTGQSIATLAGHTDTINSVAWSPDGKLLVTASNDKTIKIWDSSGALQTTLSGHSQAVNSVVWSSDGKFLVSGSSDGTVRLWQTGVWQTTKTLSDHKAPVRAVAWQPGAALFASVGDDYKMRFWNSQGQPVAVVDGPYDYVTSLSWSADGDYLAASIRDGSLWLWKTDQYRP